MLVDRCRVDVILRPVYASCSLTEHSLGMRQRAAASVSDHRDNHCKRSELETVFDLTGEKRLTHMYDSSHEEIGQIVMNSPGLHCVASAFSRCLCFSGGFWWCTEVFLHQFLCDQFVDVRIRMMAHLTRK